MFGTLALALTVAVADPRPELVELQLDGRIQEALGRVEQELTSHPAESRRLGLDYLHGHLLDRLGRTPDALQAFDRVLAGTPALRSYGRYRMAYDQDRMGHPEVAAGLISAVVAGDPASPLLPEAVRLFAHSLAEGGDCRLLKSLRPEAMPSTQRREIQLAQGECALRAGYAELARGLLMGLLQESRDDELARRAAERLTGLVADAERGRVPLLLGSTFQQHREYDQALKHLQKAGGRSESLSAREAYEAQTLIGQTLLARQQYAAASVAFSRLGELARTPADRARALFLEARAHEMRGAWPAASARYRQASQADPQGREWAGAALLSALRLEWRNGSQASALELYARLTARPEWRPEAARASLFLAASDLATGRHDRARAWLDQAATSRDDRLEVAYWRGRLAELDRDPREAVYRYLEVLRADPYHPLAGSAHVRLGTPPLDRAAAAEAKRLAASHRIDDSYGVWLLLGDDPAGRAAEKRLEAALLADRTAAPYLKLAEVPVRRWPLWSRELDRPEEMLLALGAWHEGAPAVRESFPLSDLNLAFTGSRLLARGGEYSRSIALAEDLRKKAPERIPLALLPADLRRLLFPYPYRDAILAQERIRNVASDLIAALVREETRFDRSNLYPTAHRGITQLTPNTARLLGAQLGLGRLDPAQLYEPGVSIAVDAAQIGVLLRVFANGTVPALAAYDAGEPQALVWRSWCFTADPGEYFTKIGSRDTREYVRRVVAAQAQYAALY